MKVAAEYRKHAAECRKLANGVSEGVVREQLIKMAETWERLARDAESSLRVEPDQAPKEPEKD